MWECFSKSPGARFPRLRASDNSLVRYLFKGNLCRLPRPSQYNTATGIFDLEDERVKNNSIWIWKAAIPAALLALVSMPAFASGLTIDVGYADNLRSSPFFPNPWQGSPGVTFIGQSNGGFFDSGALLFINSGTTDITVSDVTVDGFTDGASYDLWGSFVVAAGKDVILAQTNGYNFDTSDQGGGPNSHPQALVTIGGVQTTYVDSGHVLDTGGTDPGSVGQNESYQWREIGTYGGPGAPEPGTMALCGIGLMGLAGFVRKRRVSR